VNLDFYRALGGGKITDTMSFTMFLNPFQIYRTMKEMGRRLKKKNIEGNYKGEGLKTGGVVIFDHTGRAKYMYPEVTGFELEVEDLLAAVESVRQEQDMGMSTSSSTTVSSSTGMSTVSETEL
jgi:hypothetical protein